MQVPGEPVPLRDERELGLDLAGPRLVDVALEDEDEPPDGEPGRSVPVARPWVSAHVWAIHRYVELGEARDEDTQATAHRPKTIGPRTATYGAVLSPSVPSRATAARASPSMAPTQIVVVVRLRACSRATTDRKARAAMR